MAASSPARQRWALLVAVLLVIVWGSNFTVQKQVYQAMSVGGFLFARYLLLALLATALLCRQHGLHWPRLSRSEWPPMLRTAIVGQFLHVAFVTYGIHWSTAFSSSLILACGPVFTLLILRVSGKERLVPQQVVGVALACAGVLLFLSDKLLRADWSAGGGDLMLLTGALLFSLYTVQTRPLFERHGGLVTICYATLLAVLPMLLLGASAALRFDWRTLTAPIWLGFVWSVVVVAFFGWMVWAWVNAERGVARTAPLMYLLPPVAGAVAWLAGGEVFSGAKLAGAAVALVGVALAQWAGRPARAGQPG
jgi:drug/metabolite transporter (DMT)-like permease